MYKIEFLQIIMDINRFLIGSPRGSPIGEGDLRPHPYVGILRHTYFKIIRIVIFNYLFINFYLGLNVKYITSR